MSDNKPNLIILEDEAAHSEAICRSLLVSQPGWNVFVAATLEEFHNIISTYTPDLVIADMNLPDGNAFSVLKGNVESQPWPVLVMTSYGDEELAVKAIKSGALDYIVKSSETFTNISYFVNRSVRDWSIIIKSRNAETALRDSEKKFRTLFETMAEGVIYQDINGVISEANPAAEKLLGLTVEQLRAKTSFHPCLDAIHEGGDAFADENVPAAIAFQTGRSVEDVVMGLYRPDLDAYKWFMVNATPQFRNNEKEPYQVFTTFTDITELKQADNVLQQQNLDLKLAKEKAEESDRLKSAFMANMSHEIRTPMNGILGFADLLKNPDLSGESQKKYIEIIEKSGFRMLEIINDLIDISKIETGQVEIKNELVNIKALFDELILFFTPEATSRGVTLNLNMLVNSPGMINFFTDRTKLAQIITNLIKNALKFTNRDGYIEVGCLEQNASLFFYVKDSGIGIRKEIQDKIFERFRQGDKSATKIYEGVGLGLSITKSFVELLGGTIGVDSEPDRGATFFFTLPVQGNNPLKYIAPDVATIEDKHLPNINILIAEDDYSSYALLKEVLSNNHINTYHAKNGKDAIDMLKLHDDIDLVLMDIRMPVMNGLKATQLIHEIRSDIPVIAQSAFISEDDIKNAIDAGCSDYLTKPIKVKTLLSKIAEYCHH